MTIGELLYLALSLGAFATFLGVVAWLDWDYRRHRRLPSAPHGAAAAPGEYRPPIAVHS
ncbi:MAG: hypothetical protein HY246_03940 [Proteobacteria bacterium]|nr:hypothetical protein [Pseudomonadota bacterium]